MIGSQTNPAIPDQPIENNIERAAVLPATADRRRIWARRLGNLLIIAGVSFPVAYTMVAWISWVPNWLAVEAWLRTRKAVVTR